MGMFKLYLNQQYGAPNPANRTWEIADPTALVNDFFNFLDLPQNKAGAAAFELEEKQVYDAYGKAIDTARVAADNKIRPIAGLANLNATQRNAQKASHVVKFVADLDDKGDRIMLKGNQLARDAIAKAAAAEQEKIFNGDWTPTITTVIPPAATTNCNTYNLKHFGVDKSAAQYLGRFKENPKLVKALEEKAKQALLLEAVIFRFDENVGHDGTAGPSSPMTCCIRVDSMGTPKEHSHPIPESTDGPSNPSHDTYIKKNIIKCHNEDDLDSLLDIAKYLRIIGAKKNEYALSKSEQAKLDKTRPLVKCIYWNP